MAYAGVERCRSSNPKESVALKCHASQVESYMADAKKKGVPTRFAKDGKPIFESRNHQAKYLRAYGFVNKDGGYGD